MDTFELDVDGTTLAVHRFGDGPNVAVAVHGITGSGLSYGAMARWLPPQWSLVAPDLRGRGGSTDTGHEGLAGHARDVVAVIEHAADGPVVLVGHSMGAYVALLAAADRPDLVSRLILVDGGLPLRLPADADPDEVLAVTLGPALARLSRTFGSEQEYVEFFRAHPAMGPYWNDDIETYARYDATGPDGAVRSKVREAPVRVDGRELLTAVDGFGAALRSLSVPTLLLTAPGGMFDTPPGFMPEPLVAHWRGEAPALSTELVDGSNHYTIVLGAAAEVVAARVADGSTWPTG